MGIMDSLSKMESESINVGIYGKKKLMLCFFGCEFGRPLT